MACNALLGKNAAVSGTGIASGFLRDFSVAKMVELIDATGIGSTGPLRDRIVQFQDTAFSASGLTTGTAPTDAGTKVTINSDAMNVTGTITTSASAGTWDEFVLVSIQGVGSQCNGI